MNFLDDESITDSAIKRDVEALNESVLASFSAQEQLEYKRMMDWYQSAKLSSGVLKVGEQVPDLLLPVCGQPTKQLYTELETGPAIFLFFRSDWCAYCNYYMDVLRKALPAFRAGNAKMFAISPDESFSRADWYKYNSQGFDIVSDVEMRIIDTFNVGYAVPDFIERFMRSVGIEPHCTEREWRLPLTGVFIIDEDRTVAWRDVGQDYRYRATPSQILNAFNALAS